MTLAAKQETRSKDQLFQSARLEESTRVLVRPIGLDMVEVASSNLAGPTKYDRPGLVPGFSYLAWR